MVPGAVVNDGGRAALSIQMAGVGKAYAGSAVLENLWLRVEEGELIALVGPSGCGKTTLLRILAGLTAADRGEFHFSLTPEPARAPRIGYLFQEPTLLPWLTVRGNVELPLRILGTKADRRRERAAAMLARVGLADWQKARPRELSLGMKMRVALARALVVEPELLLLDEPFAALDEIGRNRLNDDLLALRRAGGWTAFFVTHSVAEAVFLADRVVILSPRRRGVLAEVPIPFGRNRDHGLRREPSYWRMVAEVAGHLEAGGQS